VQDLEIYATRTHYLSQAQKYEKKKKEKKKKRIIKMKQRIENMATKRITLTKVMVNSD
jgi:hypothetical protein